jgi:predicted nucleotidyltransferase
MTDGRSMRAVWIENQNSASYADQSNYSYAAKGHWKMQLHLAVTKLVEELQSDDSVMQVWLIGSQTSGGASLESDWDLLVFSTREASVTSARNPKIDVLWKGPSGREGVPEIRTVW